ncbi:hypothetical protein OAO87_02720 [bacterium]|nr:hypothetical protein [bacterium]
MQSVQIVASVVAGAVGLWWLHQRRRAAEELREALSDDSPLEQCGHIALSKFGSRVVDPTVAWGPIIPVMFNPKATVLAAGVPPLSTLPIATISVTLADGKTVHLDTTEANFAQRYAVFGKAPLQKWLEEHIVEQHHPRADWAVTIVPGSQAGMDLVARLLLDRGDAVFCEAFTYNFARDLFYSMGAQLVAVEIDDDGIVPRSLVRVLRPPSTHTRLAKCRPLAVLSP